MNPDVLLGLYAAAVSDLIVLRKDVWAYRFQLLWANVCQAVQEREARELVQTLRRGIRDW